MIVDRYSDMPTAPQSTKIAIGMSPRWNRQGCQDLQSMWTSWHAQATTNNHKRGDAYKLLHVFDWFRWTNMKMIILVMAHLQNIADLGIATDLSNYTKVHDERFPQTQFRFK